MGGTYTLGADGIYYPNLVSTDEEPHCIIQQTLKMPVEESSTGYEAENKGFKIKRGVIMYGKKL